MRLLLMLVLMMLAMFLRVELSNRPVRFGIFRRDPFRNREEHVALARDRQMGIRPAAETIGNINSATGIGAVCSGRAGAWLWWDHTRANEVGARPK